LTSDVFNNENLPTDWADVGLLIPHEAIRRQMTMMCQSAAAMPRSPGKDERWKITMFSSWFVDYFFVSVEEHHDAEEKIYFPWIKSKTEYPEKVFSKSHEDLIAAMTVIKDACNEILQKEGNGCKDQVALLKKNVPEFETEMRAHLKEEEETIPQALRDNFTEEENDKTVEKILQGGGFALMKKFLPAVILSTQDWATPEFYEDFIGSIPLPIKHLAIKYFIPNFENVAMTMRDAPTMEHEPKLRKVGCCGISFCFPCIL
jgi:hemerythrin superfamily protein